MEVARDDHELAPVEWDGCIDRPLVEMQSGGIGHDRAQPVDRGRRQASGSHVRLRFEFDEERRAGQVPIAEAPNRTPRGLETDIARDSPPRLVGERPFGRGPDASGCVREPLICEPSGAHRGDEGVTNARNRIVEEVVAKAQRVGAGCDRLHGTLLHAHGRADGAHLEGVRHDHSSVTQFLTEDTAQDLRVHRRRGITE
ncbi:MAG TPA: hypothetical protein VFR38_02380 [Gaiellaceae bacterium]|nr:hypothetical protein [Gaiellaceae bacterium]